MKKKICAAAICGVLIAALFIPAAFAAVDTAVPKENVEYKLTDDQKKELKELYHKKFEIQREIIKKYVDFGIIPKDKAEKKLKRMDEMQKRIEEKGFMPWNLRKDKEKR